MTPGQCDPRLRQSVRPIRLPGVSRLEVYPSFCCFFAEGPVTRPFACIAGARVLESPPSRLNKPSYAASGTCAAQATPEEEIFEVERLPAPTFGFVVFPGLSDDDDSPPTVEFAVAPPDSPRSDITQLPPTEATEELLMTAPHPVHSPGNRMTLATPPV